MPFAPDEQKTLGIPLAQPLLKSSAMTPHQLFFALRFTALATALVIPLLGCVFGGEPPPPGPRSCEVGSAPFSPERIEILDMTDEVAVDEDANVGIQRGGQGSDMVGFYIVVYGDDIPECFETTINLEGRSDLAGEWTFESDGPRRAEISNPAYWVVESTGPSRVSVTVGDQTVTHDIEITN